MKENDLQIIGRIERMDIPEWFLFGLEAKIDTGAFSSSIHCHRIEAFIKNTQEWVRFNLLDPEHEAYNNKIFELPISDVREVKSSNGLTESRYFVRATPETTTFPDFALFKGDVIQDFTGISQQEGY